MATKKKAVRSAKTTYVALVMDKSGSMNHIRHEAAACLNGVLQDLRTRAGVKVCLVDFGTTARVVQPVADPNAVSDAVASNFNEYTALRDGIGLAVETLRAATRKSKKKAEYLLVVFTDGEENKSVNYTQAALRDLLNDAQRTGAWTVAVNVPPGARGSTARELGISVENVREWEGTARGMVETTSVTRGSTVSYFAASGASAAPVAVSNFYQPVTTDMAKVATAAVKKKLDDCSDRFKRYDVKAEVVVKHFVEAKTGKPYVVGQAYYLLMKPEKVQPSKQVLIQEKGKAAVWAGPEARELIGLPAGTHARVTPGNHSNYDIYVQSASVNRKLPRGTKVLVDLKLSLGVKPTWDHTAQKVTK